MATKKTYKDKVLESIAIKISENTADARAKGLSVADQMHYRLMATTEVLILEIEKLSNGGTNGAGTSKSRNTKTSTSK